MSMKNKNDVEMICPKCKKNPIFSFVCQECLKGIIQKELDKIKRDIFFKLFKK